MMEESIATLLLRSMTWTSFSLPWISEISPLECSWKDGKLSMFTRFKVQRIINKSRHYRNTRSDVTKSKKILVRDTNSNKRFPLIFYFQNLLSRRFGFFYFF